MARAFLVSMARVSSLAFVSTSAGQPLREHISKQFFLSFMQQNVCCNPGSSSAFHSPEPAPNPAGFLLTFLMAFSKTSACFCASSMYCFFLLFSRETSSAVQLPVVESESAGHGQRRNALVSSNFGWQISRLLQFIIPGGPAKWGYCEGHSPLAFGNFLETSLA